MSQSRRGSALEATTNVLIGYSINVVAQAGIFPLFGIHIPFGTDMAIGAAFTAISIIRSYTLRRVFNGWGLHAK